MNCHIDDRWQDARWQCNSLSYTKLHITHNEWREISKKLLEANGWNSHLASLLSCLLSSIFTSSSHLTPTTSVYLVYCCLPRMCVFFILPFLQNKLNARQWRVHVELIFHYSFGNNYGFVSTKACRTAITTVLMVWETTTSILGCCCFSLPLRCSLTFAIAQ